MKKKIVICLLCINKHNKTRKKDTNLNSHEFEDVFLSFFEQIWGIPSRWRREDFVCFWLLLWVQIDPWRDFIYCHPLLPLLLWLWWNAMSECEKKSFVNKITYYVKYDSIRLDTGCTSTPPLHVEMHGWWAILTRLKARLMFPSSVQRNTLPLSDPRSDLGFFCIPAKSEIIFLTPVCWCAPD